MNKRNELDSRVVGASTIKIFKMNRVMGENDTDSLIHRQEDVDRKH